MQQGKLQVFYNQPGKSLVLVSSHLRESGELHLSIYDLYGRLVFREGVLLSSERQTIPLDLRSGVYLFELRGRDAYRGKFSVQ